MPVGAQRRSPFWVSAVDGCHLAIAQGGGAVMLRAEDSSTLADAHITANYHRTSAENHIFETCNPLQRCQVSLSPNTALGPTTSPGSGDEKASHVRLPDVDISTPDENAELGSDMALPWGANRNESAHRTDTVTLVIPARNEAGNIAWVLEQVPPCVDEIILVDGNSTDATLVTARSSRSDVHVVTQQRTGKGDALRAGFLAASGDIIVMLDADGSMSPQEIPHFLYFLSNGYDFVKGSRFMGGGGSHDITRLRRLGNRGLLLLMNALYDAHLTDLCYGFCAFRRPYLPFLDLTTPGFEIETQLTICALRAGLRIAEVPSVEMPRRHGHSNLRTFRDGTRVLRTLLREHRSGVSGRVVQALRCWVHALGGQPSAEVRP